MYIIILFQTDSCIFNLVYFKCYFRDLTFEHYEVMRVAGGYKVNVENPVCIC